MPALALRPGPPARLAALALVLALTGALGVQTMRLERATARLRIAQALHEGDIARFAAAQALANAEHAQRIAALKDEWRRLRDDGDDKAAALAAGYGARVLRIAPSPSDRPGAAAAGLPGPGPAARADGPGDDTILLARSDALICATNTARLQAAHGWATALEQGGEAARRVESGGGAP